MARRNDAGAYLLQGLSPSQIAERMQISLSSVRQYLCLLVGEGELLHSDIAFSIAERHLIEDTIRKDATLVVHGGPYQNIRVVQKVRDALRKQGHQIPNDLIELYLVARDARPDLYTLICEIEVRLHNLVRQTLKSAHGDRWWREGIPEPTRKQCQLRKEEDPTPLDEPYHYTTFVDLKSIIEKNWSVFLVALPKALTGNKQDSLKRLQTLNDIRNRVMHPVKAITEYENDYRFARTLLADFGG
jgi:hypothetical protein